MSLLTLVSPVSTRAILCYRTVLVVVAEGGSSDDEISQGTSADLECSGLC